MPGVFHTIRALATSRRVARCVQAHIIIIMIYSFYRYRSHPTSGTYRGHLYPEAAQAAASAMMGAPEVAPLPAKVRPATTAHT